MSNFITDKNGVRIGRGQVVSHNATNESICRKLTRAYPGLFEYLQSRPEELMWHEGYAAFDLNANVLRVKCLKQIGKGLAGVPQTEEFYLEMTPEAMQANGISMPEAAPTHA